MKAITFFLTGFICALGMPGILPAQSSNTHTIQQGETLFSIAREYDIDIQYLKKWNDLQADQLSIGQSIIVGRGPGNTASSSTGNTVSPGSSPAGNAFSSAAGNTRTHTVEKGETLFSVSKQYQVTVAELKEWNNLTSNAIHVGQPLAVRSSAATSASPDASATPSTASSGASSPQGKFITYTIDGGSTTVSDLIQKFQMDEEEISALNSGIRSDELRNGGEVTLLKPASKPCNNPYVQIRRSMNSVGTVSVPHYTSAANATPTTSRELYKPDALTGAHANIALGSNVFVKNPD